MLKSTKCAVFFLLVLQVAHAQTSSLIEEIEVTAQKRVESVQNVPIAITALSSQALDTSGISTHEDLGVVTPGLQYVRSIGSATPYIRGTGNNNTAPGTEASVATYIDGFYVRDMHAASAHFSGIERVEVLKGPQGTLFGRNATGGVIQTITKTPSQEAEAIVNFHLASHDVVGGGFYGTKGLTDNLAADLMVAVQRQDGGVGKNLTTGSDVGYDEYTQLRSKWLWSVSDDTDVTLLLNWSEAESDIGMLRSCAPGSICIAGLQPSPNFRDTVDDADPFTEKDGYLVGLRIDHSFGNMDFVSLTSLQKYNSRDVVDQDAGPLPGVVVDLNVRTETFSQEFQLISNNDSRLQWILGAFYWDDQPTNNSFIYGIFTPAETHFEGHMDTKSLAVFGQADYALTDATELTLGLRWTRDEKDIYGISMFGPAGSRGDGSFGVSPFRDNEDWAEVTWRLALNHKIRDDLMVYASYNRGFLSGTFNAFIPAGILQPALEPEIIDSFAIGLKGDFLDGRLRVNSELFFNQTDNMQLLRVDGPNTVLFNAAESEARGLELSATVVLSDSFSVQLNYAWLDTEYTSFPDCAIATPSLTANGGLGGNDLTIGDCSGNNMVFAPEKTVGLIFRHSVLTEIGGIESTLTYFYNDGYFAGPDEGFGQDDYSVVSVNVAWTSSDEKYMVSAYGNNLTEEEYSSYDTTQAFGDFTAINIYPREFGIRFQRHFR